MRGLWVTHGSLVRLGDLTTLSRVKTESEIRPPYRPGPHGPRALARGHPQPCRLLPVMACRASAQPLQRVRPTSTWSLPMTRTTRHRWGTWFRARSYLQECSSPVLAHGVFL